MPHRIILALAMAFAFASAQVTETPVLLLVESPAAPYQQAAQGFEQSYTTGGYSRIELDPDPKIRDARLAGLASPRLLVVIGTEAARAARRRWPTTPLVYCLALHPRQNALTGPATGGVSMTVDPADQLNVLMKLVPGVQRIGVVYDEALAAEPQLRSIARLVRRQVRNPREAARAIQELVPQVDAFWMLLDPVIANPANFRLLADLSLRHKVPILAPAAPFVEAGALVSVGPDYQRAGRRAAEIAQLVLGGRRAGDFSEAPPAYVVTINGRVARQLGIAIPRDLRANILSPQDAP